MKIETIDYPVEVQLLRDMEPRTRPCEGWMSGDIGRTTHMILTPGAGSDDYDRIDVDLKTTGDLRSWRSVLASFRINGVPYGDARPGMVWMGIYSYPSCFIHYPIMSGTRNRVFAGMHVMTVRYIGGVVYNGVR
jgi:hypothetical protein